MTRINQLWIEFGMGCQDASGEKNHPMGLGHFEKSIRIPLEPVVPGTEDPSMDMFAILGDNFYDQDRCRDILDIARWAVTRETFVDGL